MSFVASRFPAKPSSLARIRQFIAQQVAERHIPRDHASDLLQAVNEASANAIAHSDSLEITVSCERTGSCVEVQVEDQGVYRAFPRRLFSGSGNGMPIMLALVDQLSVKLGSESSPGTVVRLVKCWQKT